MTATPTTVPTDQRRRTKAPLPSPAIGGVKPTRSRRKPARIAIGVALIALCVLANVWWAAARSQTVQAAVVVNEISRGDVIEQGDLTVTDLPAGPSAVSAVGPEQAAALIGKIAAVDLLPGTLLPAGAVVDSLTPEPGSSVVGVSLSEAQMPTQSLHAGDSGRIVETPTTQGEPPADEPLSIPVVIIGSRPGTAQGQTIIDVQVDHSRASDLAARAASGRVALVLDAVGE